MEDKRMYVIKKDNTKELFNIQKVVTAINKSATRCLYKFKEGEEAQICDLLKPELKISIAMKLLSLKCTMLLKVL